VNLGVPTGGLEDESSFLVDVLSFRRIDPGAELAAMGATWFEGDDGAQIHLSVDPDHRPPARAHVAFELGGQLPTVEQRLQADGVPFDVGGRGGLRVVFCCDPAGNRWELRGPQP
jgi:hypothetical protein